MSYRSKALTAGKRTRKAADSSVSNAGIHPSTITIGTKAKTPRVKKEPKPKKPRPPKITKTYGTIDPETGQYKYQCDRCGERNRWGEKHKVLYGHKRGFLCKFHLPMVGKKESQYLTLPIYDELPTAIGFFRGYKLHTEPYPQAAQDTQIECAGDGQCYIKINRGYYCRKHRAILDKLLTGNVEKSMDESLNVGAAEATEIEEVVGEPAEDGAPEAAEPTEENA